MTSQMVRDYYEGMRAECWDIIHKKGWEGKEVEVFFDLFFSAQFDMCQKNELDLNAHSFCEDFLELVEDWNDEVIARNRYEVD